MFSRYTVARTLAGGSSMLKTPEALAAVSVQLGAIVRADVGDPRIRAAILIGTAVPVLTLNVAIVGTSGQHAAVAWAAMRISEAVPGFHLLRD